jgi:hypothetical protein
MLRPIDASMSIFNVDYKAGQVKDPSGHQFMAMQQDEIAKKAQQQVETIQPTVKPEGGVKIRDQKKDRGRDGDGKKKKGESGSDQFDGAGDEDPKDVPPSGGLNFLA